MAADLFARNSNAAAPLIIGPGSLVSTLLVCSLWIRGAHGNPDDCCVAEIRLKEQLDSMHRSLSRSLDERSQLVAHIESLQAELAQLRATASQPRDQRSESRLPSVSPLRRSSEPGMSSYSTLVKLLLCLPTVPVFAVWQRQVPVVAHYLDSAGGHQFRTRVARTISKKARPGVM